MTIESLPPMADPLAGRRFDEIEGLRAWLSWSVVGWHLVQYTGLNALYPILGSTAGLAHLAVEVFIVVSGFVVTHLLCTRQEAYAPYLVRRGFRLFPPYLIAAAFGAVTTGLAAQAVMTVPWAGDPGFLYRDVLRATHASQVDSFGLHALLHLFLLQGVVPDSLLPFSSVTFIGPAWSLSLEWQFYLIAPLLVGALRSPARAGWALAVVLAGFFAWKAGLLGQYRLMSVFPAAALLFLTGIFTRLAFAGLAAGPLRPFAALVGGLGLALAVPEFVAIGLWIAFIGLLVNVGKPLGGIDGLLGRLGAAAFGSRQARWLGARSYAVYLVHWPLLQLLLFVMSGWFTGHRLMDALLLAGVLVPLTALAAELLHRCVELPAIRIGGRFARAAAGSAAAAHGGKAAA